MALVPVQPYVFKDAVLEVDADDFASHASTIALVPSTSQETLTWQGLTPDATFKETSAPETAWALNITLAQDWRTAADTLAEYLLEHAGETKTFRIQPKRGSGLRDFTVEAVVVPPQIGGDVKTVQTSTVSLPVNGDPTPGVAA